jgi:hypothetical protein
VARKRTPARGFEPTIAGAYDTKGKALELGKGDVSGLSQPGGTGGVAADR